MDTRLYEAFVVLSEERHFSHAADRLGVSQPIVSQRIKKLEAELGISLIIRSARPVALTRGGESVLPFAKQLLEAQYHSKRVSKFDPDSPIGTVRIGYAGASVNHLLPKMVGATRRIAPGIDLKLHPMVYAGRTQGLVLNGEFDLAFSRLPLTHPELTERIVEYERVIVAVPESHPLAAHDEVDISDLKDEPWILFPAQRGSALRDTGIRLAQSYGFTPRIAQEGPDSYAILSMVAAGLGVTITLSSVAHIQVSGVKFIELSGEPRYLVATLVNWPNPSPAAQIVLDAFEKHWPTPEQPDGRILAFDPKTSPFR
jgi:DNA-binding transcriptional LysR family regulator